MKPDWPEFFITSIDAIHERFAVILDAGRCREAWLQAELFYAGRELGYDLRANKHKLDGQKVADLSCDDPPTMLAEIKVTGALDHPKMQWGIEKDVARMCQAYADAERYVVVVIRELDEKTKLGNWLNECSFSRNYCERTWPGVCRARIWRS